MPAPGGPPGMGGMSPPGGEISEQLAQMTGGSSATPKSGGSSGLGGGNPSAVQAAQMQQLMSQGGAPGTAEGGSTDTKGQSGRTSPKTSSPRPVGSIVEEAKLGLSDIFQGIKEF